jgi:hypothetical protein
VPAAAPAARLRLPPFLVPLVLLAAWLAFGPRPWRDGVAAAEAKGREPKPQHYAVSGLWTGAWVALPLALAFAGIGWWLVRRGPVDGDGDGAGEEPAPRFRLTQPSPGANRLFWVAAGVIAAATAVRQAPRLGQSLWDDEEKAMRYFTVGRCLVDAPDAAPRFRPATWTDVFFNYRQPNNHILFSVFSKTSHDLFGHPPDTPGKAYFSEPALRYPAFAAGLGALLALGWLACVLGFQRAALWAMPLLALSPWFLRYLVEARGYAQVLMLAPLCMGMLARALDGWGARWWAGFALCQFALLYSYPGAMHFLLWLNLGVLAFIAFHPDGPAARRRLAAPWLLANLGGAIALIVLMAPCVPQLLAYLRETRDVAPVKSGIFADLASFALLGAPVNPWSSTSPLSFSLVERLASTWAAWPVFIALVVCVQAGLLRLARRGWLHAALLPAMLLPFLSMPAHALLKEHPFYPWYAIGGLPFIWLLAALGADWAGQLARGAAGRRLALGAGAALVIAAGWFAAPQRAVTCSNPVEPKRDALLLIRRGEINPFHQPPDAPITIGFSQENLAYDPTLRRLNKIDEQEKIDDIIAEARASGRALFVDFGHEPYARKFFPLIFDRLDNPDLFRTVAELYGLERQNTRRIVELIAPGGAGGPPAR